MTYVFQNIINGLSLGSLYALIALGIALIFGIMGLVNLAYGELIMVGGYTLYLCENIFWLALVAVVVCVTVVFALGMERIAFRPVRGSQPATLMVTSFALSYLLQNLAILIMGAQDKAVSWGGFILQSFYISSVQIPKLSVLTICVTAALLLGLAVFLRRTKLGIQMRAAAENFRMARLLGVRADRVIAAAFGISGLLAGAVAVLLTAQTADITPTIGVAPLLVGVVATVIGGVGSLAGAVVGGYLLGGLSVALEATLPEHLRPYRDAFAFGIVILILLGRPQGLMPSRLGVSRV